MGFIFDKLSVSSLPVATGEVQLGEQSGQGRFPGEPRYLTRKGCLPGAVEKEGCP